MGESSFLTGVTDRLCSCRRQAAPACRMERQEGAPLALDTMPGPVSATKELCDVGSSPRASISLCKDGCAYSYPDCPSQELRRLKSRKYMLGATSG